MKKIIFVSLLLFFPILTGCVPSQGKDIVRSQHALNKVMVQRINNPDPNKRPSQQQLEEVVKASASSWESMDRMVNNWRLPGEK